MDECDGVCAVQLRNAFQTLRQGQLWATRCIWCEKAARQTVDGLRDAGLHLVDLSGGKNPCADGITTRGDRHGVSPSSLCTECVDAHTCEDRQCQRHFRTTPRGRNPCERPWAAWHSLLTGIVNLFAPLPHPDQLGWGRASALLSFASA